MATVHTIQQRQGKNRHNPVPDLSMEEILQHCLNKRILSFEDVIRSEPEALLKKIIGRVHKYAIYPYKNKGYRTYIPDKSKPGGRRFVGKKKKEDLYKFLLFFYGITDLLSSIHTFSDLFTEWIKYKQRYIGATNSKKSLSASTIRRYERDYERFFAGSDLEEMGIGSITPIMIEEYMVEVIKKDQLSEKSASNLFSMMKQCFDYAARSGMLLNSPISFVDKQLVLSTCVSQPTFKDSDRILTRSQMSALSEEIRRHEIENPGYLPDYAIELAILTGMRVGELAALKWSSIDETCIRIDFSEHRLDYKDAPSEIVIGEPKNRKHRQIPLTDEMRALFDRIHAASLDSGNEYVFTDHLHKRCTARTIGCAVRKRGDAVGIDHCSIHKIRRTVSSLLNQILPQKDVADLLGHSEFVNETNYHYSIADINEKSAALETITLSWQTMSDPK